MKIIRTMLLGLLMAANMEASLLPKNIVRKLEKTLDLISRYCAWNILAIEEQVKQNEEEYAKFKPCPTLVQRDKMVVKYDQSKPYTMPKNSVSIPLNALNYNDFVRQQRIQKFDPKVRVEAVYKPISLVRREELRAELQKYLAEARKSGTPTKFQALFDPIAK